MQLDPRDAIRKGLAPRSIAVIGASDNPNKIGGRPLAYLSRFGFKGQVYAINPQRDTVQGFASFLGFSALPEVPDLVIIADVQDLPCGQGRIRLIDRDALRAVEFDETPPPDRWRLMKPPMSSIPQELQVPLKA